MKKKSADSRMRTSSAVPSSAFTLHTVLWCRYISDMERCKEVHSNSTYPNPGYPDLLGPSGEFVKNFTRLSCLEITGYRIQYSTVLWLAELQIRRGRKVQTQVHTVNSNNRTAN